MTQSIADQDLTIEALGLYGDGLSTRDGQPVFIAGVLPGERVRAALTAGEGGYSGTVRHIITPSPARVAPPCPHFNDCGGCRLQYWDGAPYRDWQGERVRHLLVRAGVKSGAWLPPVFIPAQTRRRATFAATRDGQDVKIGYYRERSHDIAGIDACLLLTPRLQAALDALRAALAPLLAADAPLAVFVQDGGDALDAVLTGPLAPRGKDLTAALALLAERCGFARLSVRARDRDAPQIMVNRAPVEKMAGRLRVKLPPAAFLQPSLEGENALIAAVTAPLKKRKPKKIADLFAGCGTFTGPLLDYAPVHAVESDDPAVRALQTAARGQSTMTVEKRNLFTDPLSWQELKPFDTVIFDPPRAGAQAQSAALATSKIATIIAVSCNPVTFARDAARLQEGGYKMESIQLIDQFIWSPHAELVAVFTR